MRHVPLLLSATLLALVPTGLYAANASPATPTAAATTTTTSAATPVPSAPVFTDVQRAEIESIIKEYLTKKNPKAIVEGLQEFQNEQNADAAVKSKAALAANHDKVFNDPSSPVIGNPKGDVTLVEFFDYQCPYCKMVETSIQKLIKEDKDLRVVFKEYPVLGPSSTFAARAALASVRQEKYEKFHAALMAASFSHSQNPSRDEDTVYQVAKDTGLNVDKLKKDMKDDAIGKIVEANVSLGEDLGARGTPTFVIGDNIYPSAMEYDALKKLVDDARTAAKTKK